MYMKYNRTQILFYLNNWVFANNMFSFGLGYSKNNPSTPLPFPLSPAQISTECIVLARHSAVEIQNRIRHISQSLYAWSLFFCMIQLLLFIFYAQSLKPESKMSFFIPLLQHTAIRKLLILPPKYLTWICYTKSAISTCSNANYHHLSPNLLQLPPNKSPSITIVFLNKFIFY